MIEGLRSYDRSGEANGSVDGRCRNRKHGYIVSREAVCLGEKSVRDFSIAVIRGREIIMEMNFDRYGGVDLDSLP